MNTDVPTTDLVFVDPNEVVPTWRVGLWAEPGQGKSVAAATAPDPILVVSADRPTAYMYVRKHHGRHFEDPTTGDHVPEGTDGAVEIAAKTILETRFVDWTTMENVYRYVRDHAGKPGAIRTLVIDPLSNIFDYVVSIAPRQRRKDESDGPDYTWVNERILGFVKSLRPFDVNVVLIGHVREPRKGSTMVGPNFGGPALTEKVLRELDIVAHVDLRQLAPDDPDDETEKPKFRAVGQVQTLDTNLVCKDGTGALGAFRVLHLSRWFELCSAAFAPDDGDLPWTPPAAAASDAPAVATAPDPALPAPGTVAMPDLSKVSTKAGAKKKLKDAGCICPDPLKPDNGDCPLVEHGIPADPRDTDNDTDEPVQTTIEGATP